MFYTHWPQLRAFIGITDNISTQGMMFKASMSLEIGAIVKIAGTQFHTVAQVANCRDMGRLLRPEWHVGVKFVTIQFKSSRGIFVRDTA
jgi:hypothetical protein